MYTVYFAITYSHIGFSHTAYVSKVIRSGDKYHPLEDNELMWELDEKIQLELNESSGGDIRNADNCDFELYVISEEEFRLASNLLIKIERN